MEEYLTIKELMSILKISKNTAYNLINRNDFPKVKIGRTYRILKSELDNYMVRNIGKNLDI